MCVFALLVMRGRRRTGRGCGCDPEHDSVTAHSQPGHTAAGTSAVIRPPGAAGHSPMGGGHDSRWPGGLGPGPPQPTAIARDLDPTHNAPQPAWRLAAGEVRAPTAARRRRRPAHRRANPHWAGCFLVLPTRAYAQVAAPPASPACAGRSRAIGLCLELPHGNDI